MNKEKLTKSKKYLLLAILAVLLVGVGASYSLFTISLKGNTNYVVNSGDLQLRLDESKNLTDILQQNMIPMGDYEGKKVDGYNFSLVNNDTIDLYYTIYLVEDTVTNKTPSNDIKMYYTRDYGNYEETRLLSTTNNNDKKVIETGSIPGGATFNYNLKLWISYAAGNEILGTNYSAHLEIEASQTGSNVYADNSGASVPELGNHLVPVILKEDGTVVKADIKRKWYNYDNQEWANAVILKDETVSYDDESIIPESNIESYFVWIPRYSYKLWNLGNYNSLTSVVSAEQEIKVQFEDKNTPKRTTATLGSYYTHPAFTFGDTELNGIWVGKFETGYDGAISVTEAQVNAIASNKIVIKPNTYSWRNIQVANAFMSTYDYLREDESHMMKNTEWGAVAYLQHSKYGSISSVRINNNSDYLTGYAAVEEPITGNTGVQCTSSVTENCNVYGTDPNINQPYNTTIGYTASTTGNITGVYDMSGGSSEYVMGIMVDNNGNPLSGRNKSYNSGFSGTLGCPTCDSDDGTESITGIAFPTTKYYDLYRYGTNNQVFNSRILGDATGEMGPFASATYNEQKGAISSWHKDNSYFMVASAPWFYRSGTWNRGSGSGMFFFSGTNGGAAKSYSFRVVLAP